jgi:hypothetical protein
MNDGILKRVPFFLRNNQAFTESRKVVEFKLGIFDSSIDFSSNSTIDYFLWVLKLIYERVSTNQM